MNIRLAVHFYKIWRKLRVERRRDSMLEIFGRFSPINRKNNRVVGKDLTYGQYRLIRSTFNTNVGKLIRRCLH